MKLTLTFTGRMSAGNVRRKLDAAGKLGRVRECRMTGVFTCIDGETLFADDTKLTGAVGKYITVIADGREAKFDPLTGGEECRLEIDMETGSF